jgi:hypothetical protein
MLAKYDFIDLTVRVPDHLLLESNYQSGIPLLRQLLPTPELLDEEEIDEETDELLNGLMILEMLADDVDKGLTLCRIFLESRSARSFTERVRDNVLDWPLLILPNKYFPHRLTIRDACLTNTENVWFYKYLYL